MKFQKGETSEKDALNAIGVPKGHIRYGIHPDAADSCPKPEFDVKVSHFSFYTKREGKIAAYFSFVPDNLEDWQEKIQIESEPEESFSGNSIFLKKKSRLLI